MRETQMFEEIWKEFQREISEEQAFSLSLLMAFSWHYGEWQDDFGYWQWCHGFARFPH